MKHRIRLSLRLRITLLTGAIIISACGLLTLTSIINARSQIASAATISAAIAAMPDVNYRAAPYAFSPDELNTALEPQDQSSLKDSSFRANVITLTPKSVPASPIQMEMHTLVSATESDSIPAQLIYDVSIDKAQKNFSLRSYLYMGLISTAGMLIAYHLAGRALKPVKNLNAAISAISEDNLQTRLPNSEPFDEIQELTAAFNHMLDRLESSFWRQKRFSSNAAHELKTPLATIKTGIQILKLSEEPSPQEYAETVNITEKHVNRLIRVVDDLLAFTRDGYDEKEEPIPLQALLCSIAQDLEPLAASQELQVRTDFPKEKLYFCGNETLAYRAFYNLFENAVKYNRKNGSIFIRISPADIELPTEEPKEGLCQITIADSGIGIPEDSLCHIFDPFYRAEDSRSRALGGAGLGLSIVKEIADRHGWQLSVSSRLDEGTEFTVILPVILTGSEL